MMNDREKLRALRHVPIGKKDDIMTNSREMDGNEIGFFHHMIPPMETNPGLLRCNSTYCMNPNSKQCYKTDMEDWDYDHGRFANLFAIYGNERLLPGSELVFKIKHCPLERDDGLFGNYDTWFGFGTPVSKDQEYTLPRTVVLNDIIEFYTDDAYVWSDRGPKRGDYSGDTQFSLSHCFTNDWGWGCRRANVIGVEDMTGYTHMNIDTEITLVVTDTEAVWSWDGFRDEDNPTLSKARIAVNTKDGHFYPFFILPGCNKEGQFSAIKIIRSKNQN